MAGKTPKKTAKKAAKKSPAKKVAAKTAKPRQTAAASAKPRNPQPATRNPPTKVTLLSGGNPQIAKGYGDAPVQAYINAMPGWKRDLGRMLDEIIERTVPGVYKAVKWNSPFYGFETPGDKPGWFLGIHCMTKYIKVAFFRGTALRPIPPGESKQKEVRYLDIHEDDDFDATQFASWVKQASKLPLEKM